MKTRYYICGRQEILSAYVEKSVQIWVYSLKTKAIIACLFCLLGLLWGEKVFVTKRASWCCVFLLTQTPPSECDFTHTYTELNTYFKLLMAHKKSR